jgi:hypothetical protein
VNTVKGSEFLDKLNVLLFTSEELSSMELVSLQGKVHLEDLGADSGLY